MHAKVRANYRASQRDALSGTAGETLTLGIRDVDWPEFIRATDARGHGGRVHLSCLQDAVLLRDYDARELEANTGDSVRLIELLGGWWWAENEIGERGWLPERVLAIESGMQ